MASEYEPIATVTAAPPPAGSSSAITPLPTTPTSITSPSIQAVGVKGPTLLTQAGPTANPDSSTEASPSIGSNVHVGLSAPLSSLSPKGIGSLTSRHSPAFSPRPLTGAAAMTGEVRSREARDHSGEGRGRGQSPNPAVNALGALLGQGVSRPQDAPKASVIMSEGIMAAPASGPSLPDARPVEHNVAQPSPMSTSSLTSVNDHPQAIVAAAAAAAAAAATTTTTSTSNTTAGATAAASPNLEGGDPRREPRESQGSFISVDGASPEERSANNRAFTFPGPGVGADGGPREPLRGMSLPVPESSPHRPRSTASPKKHKCPYCSTDFTRHHNLKSHLLTHSHEKPFVCSTCQARFRRLHDLKRHAKLHTGERPHICPRCGRRFARGDALARHNKGQGGCAGRRPSVGSFTGEDETMSAEAGADDHMEGLLYSGESHESDRMDEDEPVAQPVRRSSLPGASALNGPPVEPVPSAQLAGGGAEGPPGAYHHRHPSTYPPGTAATRQPEPRPLGPRFQRSSRNDLGSLDALTSPRFSSGTGASSTTPATGVGISSMLLQGTMTESPKPLSPAIGASHPPRRTDSSGSRRHRSPSLAQQLQQQQYARRGSARSPSHVGLPPPLGGSTGRAPQLPSLPGLGSPDPKYGVSNPGVAASPSQHKAPAVEPMSSLLHQSMAPGPTLSSPLSASGGRSSDVAMTGTGISGHERGSGDGMRGYHSPSIDGVWTYIRSLEARINHLSDEVTGLRRELGRHGRPADVDRTAS